MVGTQKIGQITSGIWSPRLKMNVGLSLIERDFWSIGQPLEILTPDGKTRPGKITAFPIT
jgi:dimethylsulfoniopropionate demethylase